MKYCKNCGAQIVDDAAFCPSCGAAQEEFTSSGPTSSGNYGTDSSNKLKDIQIIALVFMIVSCASVGITIIPLAWMLPLTIVTYKKMKRGEEIGIGLKVCVLIFLSLIAGVLLLVDSDTDK